jgi:hypothetical protein
VTGLGSIGPNLTGWSVNMRKHWSAPPSSGSYESHTLPMLSEIESASVCLNHNSVSISICLWVPRLFTVNSYCRMHTYRRTIQERETDYEQRKICARFRNHRFNPPRFFRAKLIVSAPQPQSSNVSHCCGYQHPAHLAVLKEFR